MPKHVTRLRLIGQHGPLKFAVPTDRMRDYLPDDGDPITPTFRTTDIVSIGWDTWQDIVTALMPHASEQWVRQERLSMGYTRHTVACEAPELSRWNLYASVHATWDLPLQDVTHVLLANLARELAELAGEGDKMSAWDNVELSIGGKPVKMVTVDVDPAALDRTTTAPKQVDKRDIVQRLRWLAEELFDDADAAKAADDIERFRQFEDDVFHLLGEYGEPDRFGNCRCGVRDCPVLGRINEWLRRKWDAPPASE